MPHLKKSPAHHLVGETLPDGWHVIRETGDGLSPGTGGNFSVSYVAERNGAQCFVKVLDYATIIQSTNDATKKIEQYTSAFNYERDLLRRCEATRMKRVIRILGDGQVKKEGFEYPDVFYLLLEKADGDLRTAELHTALNNALNMRVLHKIAGGIRELHREGISHRDIKPSNILISDLKNPASSAKIGDLGEAEIGGQTHPLVEDEKKAGDPVYKPPEMLYKSANILQRFDADFYLLGSMILFLLMGQGATPLLLQELPYNQNPQQRQWTFREILPRLEMEFGHILEKLEEKVQQDLLTLRGKPASDLISLVKELCHPNPERRGDKKHLKKFDAGRYESLFDHLATSFERRLIQ